MLPPKRQVAGSTVGVEPRTPQKLNLATGVVIFRQNRSGKPPHWCRKVEDSASFEIVAAAGRSVNGITDACCQPSNKASRKARQAAENEVE